MPFNRRAHRNGSPVIYDYDKLRECQRGTINDTGTHSQLRLNAAP